MNQTCYENNHNRYLLTDVHPGTTLSPRLLVHLLRGKKPLTEQVDLHHTTDDASERFGDSVPL